MTSIYFNPNITSLEDLMARSEGILIAPLLCTEPNIPGKNCYQPKILNNLVVWLQTDQYRLQESTRLHPLRIQDTIQKIKLQLIFGNGFNTVQDLSSFGYDQEFPCDALILAGKCTQTALNILHDEGCQIVLPKPEEENALHEFIAIRFFKKIEPITINFANGQSFSLKYERPKTCSIS